MSEEREIWLEVALTEEEIRKRAYALGVRCDEKEELQNEKASVNRDFSNKLKEFDGEISRLSKTVRTGKEMQNVKCSIKKDFASKRIKIIRLDTGEIVKEKEMTEAESQMSITDAYDAAVEENF